MHKSPQVLTRMMENCRVSNTPAKAALHEMIAQRLLPVDGCISCPVQAQSQSAKLLRVVLRIFSRQFDIHLSGALGIEICSGHIIYHHFPVSTVLCDSSGPAEHKPQSFKRRRTCVQCIVWCRLELFPDQTATYVWMLGITLVDVNPLGPYDGPSGLELL